MFLLYNIVHCTYWVSSAFAYIVGGIFSFFLNKYFTFNNKMYIWRQGVKFTVTLAICYLIGYSIPKKIFEFIYTDMEVVVRENAALFTGMCLYTVLNYFIQRFWVFKK